MNYLKNNSTRNQMKEYIVELKQNELNEFFLEIPEEILIDLDWFDKTNLKMEIENDGSLTIRKMPNSKEIEQNSNLML